MSSWKKEKEKGHFNEKLQNLTFSQLVIPKVFSVFKNNCLKSRAPQSKCALFFKPLSPLQKHFLSSNTDCISIIRNQHWFPLDCTLCTFCITHGHFCKSKCIYNIADFDECYLQQLIYNIYSGIKKSKAPGINKMLLFCLYKL